MASLPAEHKPFYVQFKFTAEVNEKAGLFLAFKESKL